MFHPIIFLEFFPPYHRHKIKSHFSAHTSGSAYPPYKRVYHLSRYGGRRGRLPSNLVVILNDHRLSRWLEEISLGYLAVVGIRNRYRNRDIRSLGDTNNLMYSVSSSNQSLWFSPNRIEWPHYRSRYVAEVILFRKSQELSAPTPLIPISISTPKTTAPSNLLCFFTKGGGSRQAIRGCKILNIGFIDCCNALMV